MTKIKSKNIECKAAICWDINKPLSYETITVLPPEGREVRVKIIATTWCRSDAHVYTGHAPGLKYPVILGHEASGIVESVGEDVKDLAPGDHVLTCGLPQCGSCDFCKNPRSNACETREIEEIMRTDESGFRTLDGKMIYSFIGTSTFSEYTNICEWQLAKINPSVDMINVVPISCGFMTGFGAAVKVAQVHEGSTVAVWGLGAVGAAAIYGARYNGASMIIGVDIKDKKFENSKKFGCTDFVNPKDPNDKRSTPEKILELTNGQGVDYAIECVGDIRTYHETFDSIKRGSGKAVVNGVPADFTPFVTSPYNFLKGKSITGAAVGGYKGRYDIPALVDLFMENKIDMKPFISGNMKMSQINEALDSLLDGDSFRILLTYD